MPQVINKAWSFFNSEIDLHFSIKVMNFCVRVAEFEDTVTFNIDWGELTAEMSEKTEPEWLCTNTSSYLSLFSNSHLFASYSNSDRNSRLKVWIFIIRATFYHVKVRTFTVRTTFYHECRFEYLIKKNFLLIVRFKLMILVQNIYI